MVFLESQSMTSSATGQIMGHAEIDGLLLEFIRTWCKRNIGMLWIRLTALISEKTSLNDEIVCLLNNINHYYSVNS